MADKKLYVHLDMQGLSIKKSSINPLEEDPKEPEQYTLWTNTKENAVKFFDGKKTHILKDHSDLEAKVAALETTLQGLRSVT